MGVAMMPPAMRGILGATCRELQIPARLELQAEWPCIACWQRSLPGAAEAASTIT